MKIGFVGNLYGTPKGHSYAVQDMLQAFLEGGHEAHMFRIGDNPILQEFIEPTSLVTCPERVIPKEQFEEWLDKIQPDWCIFTEYMQWWDEDHDKVLICKERGIKTAGFHVHEKLDWTKISHYKNYTKIICPTDFQLKLFRKKGLYQAVYTPWGTDIQLIDNIEEPTRDGKVRFFHCAGSGGVGNRKNTDAVVKAYNLIKDSNTELIITHLNSKVFSKDEIIAFTKYADVLINTAKWDTIGLNSIEANACGRPAIVCNAPPMNELVQDRKNGLLVDCVEAKYDMVTCPAWEVDVTDLAKKMSILKNRLVLEALQNCSRQYALEKYDWSKNKEQFLRVFE